MSTSFVLRCSRLVKPKGGGFSTKRLASTTSVQLHYSDLKGRGDDSAVGSPIIIAHGMLGSSKNWTSLAKRINQETGRRIISIDARNHGESPHTDSISYVEMTQDLEDLIQTLDIPKASIIGHSMGGRTAMGLALTRPQLLDKLLVVDVSPVTSSESVVAISGMKQYFQGLLQVQLPEGSHNMAEVRKSVDAQLEPFVSDPGLRAWLAMNLYQRPDGLPGWRINIEAIAQGFERDLAFFPREWSRLQTDVPTLFVGGGKSEYIRREDHDAIKTQFRGSDIVYVPGAGHWVHAERPNDFLELVIKFL
eukprot:TRINITY_DN7506_c0_g1_i1.p1 TRINITY_DN7506_c0_g1~~TRINITY_DN7506_c0_g1_i1.p1  ORF type:complete len:306 (+),score=51.69 TRINITY_DN7506_c0_g1_i1:114-1031(+)